MSSGAAARNEKPRSPSSSCIELTPKSKSTPSTRAIPSASSRSASSRKFACTSVKRGSAARARPPRGPHRTRSAGPTGRAPTGSAPSARRHRTLRRRTCPTGGSPAPRDCGPASTGTCAGNQNSPSSEVRSGSSPRSRACCVVAVLRPQLDAASSSRSARRPSRSPPTPAGAAGSRAGRCASTLISSVCANRYRTQTAVAGILDGGVRDAGARSRPSTRRGRARGTGPDARW